MMKIDRVRVKNFKSIREVDVEFNSLNVLIGKNAAGKSNFLELFQFIKDIGLQGLEDAIHLRGGVDYFRNTRIGSSENFELECDFSSQKPRHRYRRKIELNDEEYTISGIYSTHYYLEIGFENGDYKVVNESINNISHIRKVGDAQERFELNEKTTRDESNQIRTDKSTNNTSVNFESAESARLTHPRMESVELSEKESILSFSPGPHRTVFRGFGGLTDVKIFDIDPSKIKQGTKLKGKRELEEDGENLPLVLKEIVTSRKEKDKFLNLVSDVLPFIKDWRTDTLRDKSIFLKILEEFEDEDEEYLPADLISDGTINIIALIVILYFESGDVVMIEEPERNMHPSLISKVVEMMKDVSHNNNKQVFSTSHNIELIKNVDLNNIMLVTRNGEGFTKIERPENNDRIEKFLQQGMGLEELYVKNILEEEL